MCFKMRRDTKHFECHFASWYVCCERKNKTLKRVVLTVNDHSLDHEIFIVISGYDASVITGQLDGWIDDVQSPIKTRVQVTFSILPITQMF